MICKSCKLREARDRFTTCDKCDGYKPRRKRMPRVTPKNVKVGSRWRMKESPGFNGSIEAVLPGGYIRLDIPHSHGDLIWTSSIPDFLETWEPIEPSSTLDKEVERLKSHAIPSLPGQMTMLPGNGPHLRLTSPNQALVFPQEETE